MSTITTINANDTIASSRSVINTNVANLNTDKVEASTASVDNAIARFDGTTGKVIQGSLPTIGDDQVIVSPQGFSTVTGGVGATLSGQILTAVGPNANLRLNANGSGVITLNNTLNVGSFVSTQAGGVASITLGLSGPHICFGSGVPTLSAPQGSLYLRTDGSSTSTRMYVNTNGSTGWTGVTTAT